MGGPRRAIGLGLATAGLGGLAYAVRQVAFSDNARRVRVAMETVPERYRLPLVLVLDRGYDPHPPTRGALSERLLARLTPTGLGAPVTLPSREGAPPVPAYVYDPPGRERPSGAVLWIHGGGMIAGGPWMDHALCTRIAKEHGLLVLSVDYRLAPEDPFPAGPEDCFTGLLWLHERAAMLGIDPSRIAVTGASAGGGLAASVAQMAHDRQVDLAFQGLVYPMLDDRTVLRENHGRTGALIWTPEKNRDAWGWYLGHPVVESEDRPYAAPSRREDLSGLAPAWIGVGDRDLFLDEDLDYATRLQAAGVPVELLVVPGMFHALDVAGWLPEMRDFRASLVAAIGRAVGG